VSIAGPLDAQVRRHIYDVLIARSAAPSAAETAEALGVAGDQVRAAFERLADGRALVLDRESREILMAMPFSAVPTAFVTRVEARSYYANCAWDALGILVLLKQDGRVVTSCGCCAAPMQLSVRAGTLEPVEGLVHFAVPPRHFWDNIVFT